MTLRFTSIIHQEGKWYVAYCPELGVTSQGKTLQESEKNLREAIDLYLEDVPEKDLKTLSGKTVVRTLEFNKV